MQKPQVMGLFPQPLARYSLWARSWQDQLEQEPVEFNENHSYSKDFDILSKYPTLKDSIQRVVNDFALNVMGIEDQLYITQSWINVYEQGQSIHQHNHPNSIISGTWYWSTPETGINFHQHGLNTATTWNIRIDQQVAENRPFAVTTNQVRVEENDLIVWPSYLQHSVPEHDSAQVRKTLSFNSMPRSWGSGLHRIP